ncbi:Cation efflux system protein CusC precursor [Chryseobacterium nakagawai]|uniref:TolC family protein n=1 Tax=Chryseobacterium nakagawai TaxID=1241982 RepID=A0AAD1DSN3_CHRNA|nr:TolC family protein [Chryseobacterium nakagawai]AZA92675.1 TolC family protein [Chryseobacterium nakagawai]VEH19275.1 Cation efflux system protein CusC precursor [Chryseobacterium nakagawai]
MKRRFFFLIFSLITLEIFAQGPNYPTRWTLDNCIEYAKENNISINSLRLSKNSAQQDLLQAKEAKYPNLNGTVSQGLFSLNGNDGLHVTGAQTQSIGANSSMTLYHANYIKNNEASKNMLVQMADLSVQESENNITISITQAYLNILMNQENIVSLENVLKTTQTQLKQGDQLYKAGSLSKLNYLQIQSQVAQDQYNLISAQNNLRTNIVNLKQILQLPTHYDFQIVKPDSLMVDDQLKPLQDVQVLAQNQRPEVKYGELNVENSNTNLKMAQASIQPTLSVVGNISTNYSNGNGNYFSQLGNNFYMPIGLSLGIPIYNNRIYKTQVEKSKIAIEQANLDLQNTKTILNQQIEQSYINLQNAVSQYDSASKQMDLSQQSYDIMNAQMKIGSIDYVQLQQQRLLYIQSIQNYLQAKYTAVLNKQIYEFYAGNPINLK